MVAPSFAEIYKSYCTAVIELVSRRLGRALTQEEQRWIWNVGTPMMLDEVERGFEEAASPDDVEQQLREMRTWTEPRYQQVLGILLDTLGVVLGRIITEQERAALQTIRHAGDMHQMAEDVATAPPDEREAAFQRWLAQLARSEPQ